MICYLFISRFPNLRKRATLKLVLTLLKMFQKMVLGPFFKASSSSTRQSLRRYKMSRIFCKLLICSPIHCTPGIILFHPFVYFRLLSPTTIETTLAFCLKQRLLPRNKAGHSYLGLRSSARGLLLPTALFTDKEKIFLEVFTRLGSLYLPPSPLLLLCSTRPPCYVSDLKRS